MASGFRPRDVRSHAERIDGRGIAVAGGIESEGDLVAVSHNVCWAIATGGGAEKDTGVGIHRRAIFRNGRVEFPHHYRFWVVEEVVADTRKVFDDWDGERIQLTRGANAGVEKQTRGIDSTSAENSFFLGLKSQLSTGLESKIDARDGGCRVNIDTGNPGVREDCQVWSLFGATQDWMDIGNASRRTSASIWIISH